MPADQPLACSLSALELPKRLAEIRALGDASLQSAEVGEYEAVLRFNFNADPGTRERLEAIVVAESRCCAFLELYLEHTPQAAILTIRAPKGGEPVMHGLVEAFRGGSSS